MSEENAEALKRALDAANRRDIESFLDTLDPKVEWDVPGSPAWRPRWGREEVREMFQKAFEAFPDLRFEISEIRDLGDRVLAVVEMRGAWHGKEIESPWTYLIQVRNGMATHARFYLDPNDALKAAGLSE